MKKKAFLLVILSMFCISIFSGCNTKRSEDLQSKNNVSESKKENKDGSPDHKLKEDEYQIVKKSNGETVLYVGKSKTKVEALLNFTLRIFSGDNVRDKVFIYKVLNDKQVDVFSEKVDAYIKSTYEIVLGNLNEDERKNFLDENIKYFKSIVAGNANVESYNVIDENTISFEISISGVEMTSADMKSKVDSILNDVNNNKDYYSSLSKSKKRQQLLNAIIKLDEGKINKQKITVTLKASDGKWSMEPEDIDKILKGLYSFNNKEEVSKEIVKLLG